MDRQLSPEEIQDLLAAYAIDAVDDDERREIDEYLAGDPEARAEVSGLQHSASYLAHTGGPPPPGVWERLEAVIQESVRPDATVAPPRLVPNVRRARHAASLAMGGGGGIGRRHRVRRALVGRRRRPTRAVPTAPPRWRARPRARPVLAPRSSSTPAATCWRMPWSCPTAPATSRASCPRCPRAAPISSGVSTHRNTISLGVMGRSPSVVAFQAAGHPVALAVTEERRRRCAGEREPADRGRRPPSLTRDVRFELASSAPSAPSARRVAPNHRAHTPDEESAWQSTMCDCVICSSSRKTCTPTR